MAKPSLIAFSMPLLAVGLLSAQPRAQALCPRFGGSLEKSGVLAALQKVGKVIPAEYSDARLSAMYLDYVTVCSVEFYSASHRQRLIVIMEANVSLRTADPATSQRVLPDGLVDLPTAIDAAVKQGMRLPLNSAKLMMAQPRGKPAVAVWTLCPRADPQGRVLCYFVSAADAGHPLKLSDVTDYFRDYNSQWRYISDLFHANQ